jgi:hypothetical protein
MASILEQGKRPRPMRSDIRQMLISSRQLLIHPTPKINYHSSRLIEFVINYNSRVEAVSSCTLSTPHDVVTSVPHNKVTLTSHKIN